MDVTVWLDGISLYQVSQQSKWAQTFTTVFKIHIQSSFLSKQVVTSQGATPLFHCYGPLPIQHNYSSISPLLLKFAHVNFIYLVNIIGKLAELRLKTRKGKPWHLKHDRWVSCSKDVWIQCGTRRENNKSGVSILVAEGWIGRNQWNICDNIRREMQMLKRHSSFYETQNHYFDSLRCCGKITSVGSHFEL